MLAATSLLTLTALLSTVSAQAKEWSGLGQVRTLYIDGNHEDLGCLTNDGKWTVDEPLCGTFHAVQVGNGDFQLGGSSGAAACGITINGAFQCGGNVGWKTFSTFGVGNFFPVPGRDVLRYAGLWGIFATSAPDSPPAPGAEPLTIHFYSGSEKGKWVFLGWQALE